MSGGNLLRRPYISIGNDNGWMYGITYLRSTNIEEALDEFLGIFRKRHNQPETFTLSIWDSHGTLTPIDKENYDIRGSFFVLHQGMPDLELLSKIVCECKKNDIVCEYSDL